MSSEVAEHGAKVEGNERAGHPAFRMICPCGYVGVWRYPRHYPGFKGKRPFHERLRAARAAAETDAARHNSPTERTDD